MSKTTWKTRDDTQGIHDPHSWSVFHIHVRVRLRYQRGHEADPSNRFVGSNGLSFGQTWRTKTCIPLGKKFNYLQGQFNLPPSNR